MGLKNYATKYSTMMVLKKKKKKNCKNYTKFEFIENLILLKLERCKRLLRKSLFIFLNKTLKRGHFGKNSSPNKG